MFRGLKDLIRQGVGDLLGREGDALQRAMRILSAIEIGSADQEGGKKLMREVEMLMALQEPSGAWGPGKLCSYGSGERLHIGNRGVTCAVVCKAIRALSSGDIL